MGIAEAVTARIVARAAIGNSFMVNEKRTTKNLVKYVSYMSFIHGAKPLWTEVLQVPRLHLRPFFT
jgi:hypothetical protein